MTATFEGGIHSLLTSAPAVAALVGEKIWPDIIPQQVSDSEFPIVVYSLAYRAAEHEVGGTAELRARLSVEIYALTKESALDVAEAIYGVIVNHTDYTGATGFKIRHSLFVSQESFSAAFSDDRFGFAIQAEYDLLLDD